MAQSVARQWPALPNADPESLRLWAAQITKLLQEGAIVAGLGPGDVVGPATAGNGNVPIFSGTTGELLADSGLPFSAIGNRYGVVPFVAADGVTEIGRYIDFHNSDADAGDNANRLETNGGIVGLFEHPSGGVVKRIVSLIDSTLAQGDVLYFDGANFVRLAPGTSGQFLKTNGAAANPAWAAPSQVVNVVDQGAISAAATLDIALGTADMYEIDLINVKPVTDNVTPFVRFSQSGSFLAGGSDYAFGQSSFGADVRDIAQGQIELLVAGSLGNDASPQGIGTVTFRIYRPSAAAFQKSMTWNGYMWSNAPQPIHTSGGGALIANTDAIDGFRFLFSGGSNIASGYYAVRSYSFT